MRWGIADFRRRFGREPAGMWLPETAVDAETLDVLAAEGSGSRSSRRIRCSGRAASGLPGRYRTAGGREIALFVYDGAISHDVAFGGLIRDAQLCGRTFARARGRGGMRPSAVAVATDGETYGHHHHFGEVALAWMLDDASARRIVRVENFAVILARHPPTHEVTPRGADLLELPARCGAMALRLRLPHRAGACRRSQRWRAPLRGALDWLAGELHALFEREGTGLLGDPWEARDA